MYKYKRFCEIYDHQLLKTRALKRVKPKMIGSYWTQGHPKPGSWLELYLGLSRRKDQVLVGFKLLKSRLWYLQFLENSFTQNSIGGIFLKLRLELSLLHIVCILILLIQRKCFDLKPDGPFSAVYRAKIMSYPCFLSKNLPW